MASLHLEDVEPGMELAQPVENKQGKVLVNAGVVLSEGMLRALANWGITEVNVISVAEDAPSSAASVETLEQDDGTEHELQFRFRKTDLSDPVIQELFQLALKLKLQQVNTHQQ